MLLLKASKSLRKCLLHIFSDLSYDQAEDSASHLRQRQNRLNWCEGARGDLPGVRDDLPCAEWYALILFHALMLADKFRFPQGLIQLPWEHPPLWLTILYYHAPPSTFDCTLHLIPFLHDFGSTANRFNTDDGMHELTCTSTFLHCSQHTLFTATNAYKKGVRSRGSGESLISERCISYPCIHH